MQTGTAGIRLIKNFEGCELDSYLCPAGEWTIGFGHTSDAGNPHVVPGMKITRGEAEALLARDLKQYEDAVTRLVKVSLTSNQFDALVSFTYNLGAERLENSTLLKKLNAKNYDAVPAELMKWTRADGKVLDGLVKRRRAEAQLWRGMSDAMLNTREARTSPENPKASKTIFQSKEGNAALFASVMGGTELVSQVAQQATGANSAVESFLDLFGNPRAAILVVVIMASLAIWYWRKQRLEEEAS
jgi:lysozyme